jgi:NADPH2:quinone reductase
MRAIEAKTFSGYDALRQAEYPKPQPAKDRVLVRVTAAGVTPIAASRSYLSVCWLSNA